MILIRSSSARLTLPWINRFYLFSPYAYEKFPLEDAVERRMERALVLLLD
jgi:hypothetical protein